LLLPKSNYLIHCDGRTWWLLSAMNPSLKKILKHPKPIQFDSSIQRDFSRSFGICQRYITWIILVWVVWGHNVTCRAQRKNQLPTWGAHFDLRMCIWLQLFILVQ
jgi:hypothetical protein